MAVNAVAGPGESGRTCDIAHLAATVDAPPLQQGIAGWQQMAGPRHGAQHAGSTQEFNWDPADQGGRRSRIVSLNLQLNMSSRCDTLSL
jgi:hypothetical protein